MTSSRASPGTGAKSSATRFHCRYDTLIVYWMLASLVPAAQASAGEQDALPEGTTKPPYLAPRVTPSLPELSPPFESVLPDLYKPAILPEFKSFSSRDFRPRGHSILDNDPQFGGSDYVTLIRGTTVWQRLSEYRSRDRLRLVTLWESVGGTVSLQTNKKGDPSLQWTSRAMNRGGATRGVFDELLTSSLGGFGHGSHSAAHSTGFDPAAKPSKLLDAGTGPSAAAK